MIDLALHSARAIARCSLVTFLLTLHVVAQLGVSLYLAIQYILEGAAACSVQFSPPVPVLIYGNYSISKYAPHRLLAIPAH